ncbi:MAG TPA: TetR/AcrR family transcriptional regulator [Trebonia sp.]|nr:TetR/AcrR family transcriptional regulator [Trebonia sp.]
MEETGRPRRPHTGRRRNEAAREAILDATMDLMYADDGAEITIDAIAHAAGVGRQTIYRWWPSKGAVAAEAMARHAQAIVPVTKTGSFRADLLAFISDSFAGLADDRLRGALRRLAAGAQSDEHVAQVLAEFTAQRRAALRQVLEQGVASGDLGPGANLPMLVDMAYGLLWYRVLVGHAPLDADAARDLTSCLLAAGRP